jgi:hypothetical protein
VNAWPPKRRQAQPGQCSAIEEITMEISNVRRGARAGAVLSAIVLVGGLATPSHAVSGGTTTVKVISNVLRIYDGNSYDHSLSINDDGTNAVWVGDVVGNVSVGPGCSPKTVSGVAGATCPKSGFASLQVNYTGGNDFVFDNRTLGTAKAILVYLGAGDDYFKAWYVGNNPSEVHGGFGNDIMWGSRSADKFYGDENNDELHGSQTAGAQSADILDGGVDNDQLFSKNQMGSDTVACSFGIDSAQTDLSDTVSGCETVTH